MAVPANSAVASAAIWGVMMAAMMLPGAVPMVALYRVVGRAMAARTGRRPAPVAVFVAPYLLVWAASGLPAYGAWTTMPSWHSPYTAAAVLAGAGVYQFTAAKRACLRHCRAPLMFLAERWRPGVAGAVRLGLAHAGYCLGCCWALMVVLVAVGSMGLPWVSLLAALVLVEKALPHGDRVGRAAGVALVLLALAVLISR